MFANFQPIHFSRTRIKTSFQNNKIQRNFYINSIFRSFRKACELYQVEADIRADRRYLLQVDNIMYTSSTRYIFQYNKLDNNSIVCRFNTIQSVLMIDCTSYYRKRNFDTSMLLVSSYNNNGT